MVCVGVILYCEAQNKESEVFATAGKELTKYGEVKQLVSKIVCKPIFKLFAFYGYVTMT